MTPFLYCVAAVVFTSNGKGVSTKVRGSAVALVLLTVPKSTRAMPAAGGRNSTLIASSFH